jgi:hypothetical protein
MGFLGSTSVWQYITVRSFKTRTILLPSLFAASLAAHSFSAPCLQADEPDERAAVPAPADIAKSEKLVKELLGDEFAKTKPANRGPLAVKLLQQANETKDDLVGRFVLLSEARDTAAKAGDPLTAARAAEQLASEYRISAGAAREPLAALGTAPMSTETSRSAADVLLAAADASAAGESWDSALALLKAAESAARRAKNIPMTGQVRTRSAQIEKMKAEADKVKDQLVKLKSNPDDAAANLAVGRFLCLVKRDWDGAIPLLSKGASGPLKAAVDTDIKAADGDEAAKIAAADAWYDMASKVNADAQKNDLRGSLQLRAYHWYSLAVSKATGLNKAKAEKRIKELQAVAEAGSDRVKIWMNIRKAMADQKTKHWPIIGGFFGRQTYEEVPDGGAVLIGFRYTIGRNNLPGVMQPIFLTPGGEVGGRIYGQAEPGAVPQIVKAKPGYAIGAIFVRGGGGFDAFKPIFMRIKDKGLDLDDQYEGTQVGGDGGSSGTVGGDGNFIVGVHGKINDKGKMECLSVISLTSETAASKDSSNNDPPAKKKHRGL